MWALSMNPICSNRTMRSSFAIVLRGPRCTQRLSSMRLFLRNSLATQVRHSLNCEGSWNRDDVAALTTSDRNTPPSNARRSRMASADSSNADEPIADAIDLLTRDHRLVEELFAAFSLAAPQQLEPLARRACKMLRVHTQIEEELFYPVARRALQNDDIIN